MTVSNPVVSVVPFLRALAELAGSDLHIKVGSAPRVRLNGRLLALQAQVLSAEHTERMVAEVLPKDLVETFARTHEADFALSLTEVGRFRVNAFRQRGSAGLVFRRVASEVPRMGDLGLPDVVGTLAMQFRGLVLVTGPTGSGKTTTLAAMIDHINTQREAHIVTIEDPIEILHRDKNSIINQREVRTDTADFTVALRSAMRQDPDVILVGEMRDAETVRAALSAAETGHLVLSTLHTTDAAESVNRVIDFFPPHEQQQVRLALAGSLRGIICQRLVPRADGSGRVAALEVCVGNGRVAEALADPTKTSTLTTLVEQGGYDGMQSFDQHLVKLVQAGTVALDDAKRASSRPHDLIVELRRLGVIV